MVLHPLIPLTREVAVATAFRSAFNRSPPSDFRPLKGGASGAGILHFAFDDRSFVLRIEPERIALHDRRRGYACFQAAAAVGAAPRIYVADADNGVAIMDYVRPSPLSGMAGGPAARARAFGALIAKVQTTPLFPSLGSYPEVVENLLTELIMSSHGRLGDLDRHRAGLSQITAALSWDPDQSVSAHNDPNPRNILFDGERLWLVDWELAFANDPLVDVAILTTEQTPDPELEILLMQAAFGVTPDRRRLARLHAIRTLTRLFYGCMVLSSPGVADAPSSPAPAFTPSGFRSAIESGLIASGSPAAAHAFGRMSLAAFAQETSGPRFQEILRRLAQG